MIDAKKAVICFQYAERVKSELIIAAKLLQEISGMKNNESIGAEKIILSFLDALLGEVRIASNVSGVKSFEDAGVKVEEAMRHARLREYSEALRRISEAISLTTTGGQQAAQTLKDKGLI